MGIFLLPLEAPTWYKTLTDDFLRFSQMCQTTITVLLFAQLNVHVYPFHVFLRTRKIHLQTQTSTYMLTVGIAETCVSHIQRLQRKYVCLKQNSFAKVYKIQEC